VVQQNAAHAGFDVVILNLATVEPRRDAALDGEAVLGSANKAASARNDLFDHYIRAIRRKRYDVVIFAETFPMDLTARSQLIGAGTPVIMIGGVPHPATDRVYIDDYGATRELMSYLIGKGHTTIAHITGVEGMLSSIDRLRGYRDGLMAAGLNLAPDLEVQGTFLRDGGYCAMQSLLARHPRPTAVFAANDLTAHGALLACIDANIRVPEQVAIAGFDDIALASDLRPALTTIYHGQREIGAEVVRLALTRARRETLENHQTITVPHRLIVRQSA
jgi:LacI family transcriptional regulator